MSISIAEAARLLRTNQQFVYQQLRNGQLTSRNVSGRRVITEGGLQEYVARKQRRKVNPRRSRFNRIT
ncbi:MAG: helix-turn-helix domain-containing protein [Cyanobacteria bacterium P01_F01_bin.143]